MDLDILQKRTYKINIIQILRFLTLNILQFYVCNLYLLKQEQVRPDTSFSICVLISLMVCNFIHFSNLNVLRFQTLKLSKKSIFDALR